VTEARARLRTVHIEPTLDGWRAAARALLLAGVHPTEVAWREQVNPQLELMASAGDVDDAGRARDDVGAPAVTRQAGAAPTLMSGGDPSVAGAAAASEDAETAASPFRVPRRFLELARTVACHEDRRRWALLYRVLWRVLHGEPRLLDVAVDDDVHRLLRMDKAVRRDVHKVHAFVRFRRVLHEGGERFVAWFAPTHDCLALAAPFFARRFPNMHWAILGPRRSAHWDTRALRLAAGVPRDSAPSDDALEAMWRTYYASIFNPARTRPRAMRAEMPRKYWHLLPEAAIVPDLVADAPARVRRMLEAEARPPRHRRPATRERPGPAGDA
jgi:DNA polymerase